MKNIFFAITNSPRKLQLEITNRCNLNCGMCPRTELSLEYKDMDLSVLKCIAQKMPPHAEIILTGWGEPLLHADVIKAVSLFKNKNCMVRITTNGVLLNRDMAKELIGAGIDSISVSVDSFNTIDDKDPRHKCNFIKDNIRNLISMRGNRKKPTIILQPTLHKGKEKDIYEIIEEGKKLGVDRINVARLDTRFNKGLKSFTLQEEREIQKNIIALSDKFKIRVDMAPFIAFTGLKRFFNSILAKVLYSKNISCPKLFNYIYITHTGKATPCCALPKYEVGDLLIQSLDEIWHGTAFDAFRRRHKIMCEGCDVLQFSS